MKKSSNALSTKNRGRETHKSKPHCVTASRRRPHNYILDERSAQTLRTYTHPVHATSIPRMLSMAPQNGAGMKLHERSYLRSS